MHKRTFPRQPQLLCILSACLLLGSQGATAAEISPFRTDGCSLFPDGTPDQPELWLDCCRAHDLAYWRGGTYGERLEADRELEACVLEAGEPEIAKIMLAGVRVGGSPFLPTSFRWGYGWPYLRGYEPLSVAERAAVQESQKGESE